MMCLPITNDQQQQLAPSSSCCISEDGVKVMRGDCGDFVRQPCKARGVSISPGQNPHVARHAYIDIPVGTMHGTVLSCSHPVCIASGRRFRYCAHCKTAVAKRNFNVRHAHGSLNSPPPKNVMTPTLTAVVSDSECDKMEPLPPTTIIGVPSVISVDDHKSVKSIAEDHDGTTTCVPLNRYEMDFLNVLRSRPGNDYPLALEKWKDQILALAEKVEKKAPEEALSFSSPDLLSSDVSSVASFGPDEQEDGQFEDFDFGMMLVDCFDIEC